MEQKTCPKCSENKELSEFHKNKKRGSQTYCKSCRKEMDKFLWKKRSENTEKMIHKKQYSLCRKETIRRFLFNYLLEHPCVDCGNKDPIVLNFDHLRDKKFNISIASGGKISLDSLKEEIEKCEIRCANCHTRKTAKDFNYYTYRYSLEQK